MILPAGSSRGKDGAPNLADYTDIVPILEDIQYPWNYLVEEYKGTWAEAESKDRERKEIE